MVRTLLRHRVRDRPIVLRLERQRVLGAGPPGRPGDAAASAGRRYIDHLVTHETCHQWWWNTFGTNGYAETFMDEGLVNGFTALRLDAKYGRNGPLIAWPEGLTWLPTIGREDL